MKPIARRLFLLCLGLLASHASQGEDGISGWQGERLRFSAFGTLGLARSDSDSAEYVRDLSQPHGLTRDWSSKIDTILGAQANLRLGQQSEGVLQLISRYRYDGSYDPEISWAFLRHDFSPDFQVRLGRLGTEFYLNADSRLIGYSNLTVRPPPDFYGPLVFNYIDGIDASAALPLNGGVVRMKLFAGRSPESTGFYPPVTWNLSGSHLSGIHLDYLGGPWQVRIGHMQVRFGDHEIPLSALAGFDIVGMAPELSTLGTTSRFDSLGMVYDKGPLLVQAMTGRIRHETESYEDSRAAFIIGAYRLGEFTPYLGYSRAKSSPVSISTPLPPLPGLDDLLRATHMDQRTVTLGLRWDFRQHLALKFQFDAIRGTRESAFLFRGPNLLWDGSMNVLSTTLDFAF